MEHDRGVSREGLSGPGCEGERCPAPPSGVRADTRRGLWIAMILTFIVMFAELVGGLVSNSLALLADAGHMLTDVAALALSLVAFWFASRPASPGKSYGYRRIEILAALVNGVTLVVICLFIFYEAYDRFREPPEVQAGLMMGVAVVGLVANLISAWILQRSGGHAHHHHAHGGGSCGHGVEGNLNVRGAYLHVLGDALGSVGVIVAAILVQSLGWTIADPVISVGIGLIIIVGAVRLVLQSVDVLMEATPSDIDPIAVTEALLEIDGVVSIHDLHIWTITSGMPVMTVHAVVAPGAVTDRDNLLHRVAERLRTDFRIEHATVQLEGGRDLQETP